MSNTDRILETNKSCEYQNILVIAGLKCKECKFKCHKDCESKVPPSCGLPRELVDEFAKLRPDEFQSPSLTSRGVAPSPSHRHGGSLLVGSSRGRKKGPHLGNMGNQQLTSTSNIAPYPGPDSSSNTSSCNSSTPSSPALLGNAPHTPLTLIKAPQQFHFPDVTKSGHDVTLETHPLSPVSCRTPSQQNILSPPPATTPGPLPSPLTKTRIVGEMAETQRSNDSDRTIVSLGTSGSGSTDSERTPVRVDSLDSQVSDGETGMEKSAWPRQNSDILMLCWSYHSSERPEFASLLKTLDKLPKKRLARSPSHPVHLSRSAESVF
ncbi:hypothetical protein B566_EDAN015177 [Ephemera danica]|nr:hypothetical protein B566_EDAN015177 [Ephemera danica]